MVYTVKKLSKLAGVSIRTLHVYDEMGLLKPGYRTETSYRMYGEKELLRLQQILFYKELDIPLKSIAEILDTKDFDTFEALEAHKHALAIKRARIDQMLSTIDKTIQYIKGGTKMKHEELYEGFPAGKAEDFRNEAIGRWGNEQVSHSENSLLKLGKAALKALKTEQDTVVAKLAAISGEDPRSEKVQELVAEHYRITRTFWGTLHQADPQKEAYAGLGQLFADDGRYMISNGIKDPGFGVFMKEAMTCFAESLNPGKK